VAISSGESKVGVEKKIDKKPSFQDIDTKDLKTKAGRSNCVLSTNKLKQEGLELPNIYQAIEKILINYK
jgi:hypothetical protein